MSDHAYTRVGKKEFQGEAIFFQTFFIARLSESLKPCRLHRTLLDCTQLGSSSLCRLPFALIPFLRAKEGTRLQSEVQPFREGKMRAGAVIGCDRATPQSLMKEMMHRRSSLEHRARRR